MIALRDYANIVTAIWRDDQFRALSASAQRTYLMLITQEDISGAGTLSLTTRRWASNAADTNRDDIERDLKILEAAGFVFADEDEEELLVRSFVKHDKGYSNPKRRPVILAAAMAIRSPKLRRVLWPEMQRLGLGDSLPELPTTSTDSLSGTQSHGLSDGLSAQNRVVVTVVGTDTSTLKPQLPPSAVGASRATRGDSDGLFNPPEAEAEPNAGAFVAYWLERCRVRPPDRVIGQMSKELKRLVEEKTPASYIEAGIDEWMAKDLSPSNLPNLVNSAMNRTARASPNANGPKESTSDRRVREALEAAAAFQTGNPLEIEP